jgi:hypothetical protein
VLRDDYGGDFDPAFELSHLSRQALAVLGREYMLSGQLQDRSAMPMVLGRLGVDARIGIAIDEWMSASPLYSARMQRALQFSGTDIGTLFKNLQLDIGFSHPYMHVGYRLESDRYGEFWLDCCGALMDVEPFGEDMVRGMCHDIEDPTFDATAAATNPLIKIRPIHRPPRSPADREPHCHWKVFIDDAPSAEPFEMHPNLAIVSKSKLADVALIDPGGDAEPGGRVDYAEDFDPDFTLEDLSHRALVLTVQEFAVQCHVLCRSFLLTMAQRLPEDEVRAVATAQWTGIAGLTAERLRAAMRIDGDDAVAIAKLFQLHPSFHPRSYVDTRVEVLDDQRVLLSLGPSPAFEESDSLSWLTLLGDDAHPAIGAIARVGNPRARAHPARREGAHRAWEIVIDPQAEPAPEPPDVALSRLSTGSTAVNAPRRKSG